MTPEERAIDIASRGISSVKMGDREHRYLTPAEALAAAKEIAADALDETYGGFFNVELNKPS